MKNRFEKWAMRAWAAGIDKVMPFVLDSYYSMYSPRWHPHYALRQEALAQTVEYIKTHMPDATIKNDHFQVLSYACSRPHIPGLYMEFGVRTGSTINHLAKLNRDHTIFGFDSFEGLPENWSGWVGEKGAFARAELPSVRANVRLIKGWFDATLQPFLQAHPGDVALVHIDSDLYSSAKTVLDNLAPRIRPGTLIVFNEYFNYPNWQQHEFKAFQEFCATHRVKYRYLCWEKFAVAIEILGTG